MSHSFQDYLNGLDDRSSPSPQDSDPAELPQTSREESVPRENPLLGNNPVTPAPRTNPEGLDLSATSSTSATAAKRRLSAVQFVDVYAFEKKLKPQEKGELVKFAKASDTERLIMQHAILLKLTSSGVGTGAATHAVLAWEVPDKIKKNIDKYVMRILLSPNLAKYFGNSPIQTLMGIIKTKSHWGLPADVDLHEDKWDKLVAHVRNRFIQRRSDIKTQITLSFSPQTKAQDIVTLCTKLAAYGNLGTDIVVTVQLCARVAYLRQCLKTNPKSPNYWKLVDSGLETLRTKAKESNDPAQLTKRFATILKDDRKVYGAGQDVHRAVPSESQNEIEEAISSGTYTSIAVGAENADEDEI
ncbi:hypothetical protein HYDPIDRAFT_166179 [Hydnomerulius pinastri MD-312]|nr:hypothetical protein HYDPIDRAFT_166179 [Hydnomerulius pinastri MD-312]